FARIGVPHCPICGSEVHRRTPQAIVDEVLKTPEGTRLMILAPVVKDKKGEFAHIPEQYSRLGFARARVDGIVYALDEFPELNKNNMHNIEIVVDRIAMKADVAGRVSQSVEQALDVGGGVVELLNADTDEVTVLSQRYACPNHPAEPIP